MMEKRLRDVAREGKLQIVRAALEQDGYKGVVISSQASLCWLFEGRYHVGLASETGVAQVLVTLDAVEGLVANNEYERLVDEEGFCVDTCHVYPWHEEEVRSHCLAQWLARDRMISELVWGRLQALRVQFGQVQQKNLGDLAQAAAQAVEHTCRQCNSSDSEQDIAGRMAAACYASGIEPVTVLVAGHRRSYLYKHPLPTAESLDRSGILSLCARRDGVVVSVTRMVAFGFVEDGLRRVHQAVLRVDAQLITATEPGRNLGDLMRVAVDAYKGVGFEAAWQSHHQGGLAGYQSRELRATPTTAQIIERGQIYAWNPTLPGAKSEDTLLVSDTGPVLLSRTGRFPEQTVTVAGRSTVRPDILVLP